MTTSSAGGHHGHVRPAPPESTGRQASAAGSARRYAARGTSTAPSRRQVIGAPLDVDDATRVSVRAEQVGQGDHGHLRGIRAHVELRLACEQATDLHPEQPTRECPGGVPHLDRVRPAEVMQRAVGAAVLRADPPVRAARVGAGGHDVIEGHVDADLEARQHPPQRAGDVHCPGRQDTAGVRGPPAQEIVLGHGEQPAAVPREQHPRGQVGPHGHQFLPRRQVRHVGQDPAWPWRLDGHRSGSEPVHDDVRADLLGRLVAVGRADPQQE